MLLAIAVTDADDIFLGGAYRLTMSPDFDLGLSLSLSTRANNKYTQEQVRTNFFVQREEERYVATLTLDKIQMLTRRFGVYLGAGAGYSTGLFQGTSADPESGWSIVVDVGLTSRFAPGRIRGVIRAGYQRADRITSNNHMGYLAVGFDA